MCEVMNRPLKLISESICPESVVIVSFCLLFDIPLPLFAHTIAFQTFSNLSIHAAYFLVSRDLFRPRFHSVDHSLLCNAMSVFYLSTVFQPLPRYAGCRPRPRSRRSSSD